MASFKIANILLENTRQFHQAPTLYIRSSAFVTPNKESSSWRITGPGMLDFTTFFNALSVEKWLKYTNARSFTLHLELRGDDCDVELTHAGRLDLAPAVVADSLLKVESSSDWQSFDIPLPVQPGDVLLGFTLKTEGEVELGSSYYAAEVEDSAIREIELAVCTTTFRKEEYIERNIRLMREQVFSADNPMGQHISMHVVDNGRTLDAEALTGDGVRVHPNPNAGGAGGFARGMIEAERQEAPATHVLLMDDDVEVSPESIMRTYALLAIMRDEYTDAFVAGAMMSWDRPDLLWEDGGYFTSQGVCGIVKKYEEDASIRMSDLSSIVANETFTPNLNCHPDLIQRYSAWWYCCIPAKTIRREGLPLPLFVRYDDVEYSLRCKPQFITMNGICIWHLDFSLRYNSAVERYQSTRNGFVIHATSDAAPLSNFEGQLVESAQVELTKFCYADAALILDGFEDYLRGPGYLFAPGKAEETYMAANRRREQLIAYDELREQVLAEFGVDLNDFDPHDISQNHPLGGTPHNSMYRVAHMQTFMRSLNGQLFGRLKPYNGPLAVVHARSDWPFGKIYGVEAVVAIDVPNKKGILRRRDSEQAKVLWNRLQSDLKEYHRVRDELDQMYREARPLVTSTQYWEKYLGLV